MKGDGTAAAELFPPTGASTRSSFLTAVRLLTNRCYIDGILFRLVRAFAAYY
jgi:hypothetical protein